MSKSTEFYRSTIGKLKVGRIVLNLFGWSTNELLERCQNEDFFKTLSMKSILDRSYDSTNYFGVLSAPYWPRNIISRPVPPHIDPVPPSTNQYCFLLSPVSTCTDLYCPELPQYHHMSNSITLCYNKEQSSKCLKVFQVLCLNQLYFKYCSLSLMFCAT